jgi:hypothetical protein
MFFGWFTSEFFLSICGSCGVLSPFYIPNSLSLEFRRLFIEYSVWFMFPLLALEKYLEKPFCSFSKTWSASALVVNAVSVACFLTGGFSYTPYLPFTWCNPAVLTWISLFTLTLYCYRKYGMFSKVDCVVASFCSIVLASWLYEVFDPRLLQSFPDYFLVPHNWIIASVLLTALFWKYHFKFKINKLFVFGAVIFVLGQATYLYSDYVVGPSATWFWQTWDIFIRLTVIPLFVSIPLMLKQKVRRGKR